MGQMRKGGFCVVLVTNVLWLVVDDVERDCDHYLMMCVQPHTNGQAHKYRYSVFYPLDSSSPCTVWQCSLL